jgi:hypothetical protein
VHAGARGVELLHVTPDPNSAFHNRHFESRHSSIGDIGDVLDIVEKGDRVVVAPEQQDLSVERNQAIQRRIVAVGIAPRLRRAEVIGVFSPGDEACNVPVDLRSRESAEELHQRPVISCRARRVGIEGRQLLENLRLL